MISLIVLLKENFDSQDIDEPLVVEWLDQYVVKLW